MTRMGVGAGRFAGARLRLAGAAAGIGAIGAKELRGRMRGRRAFVILTVYLVLLGGFAWMVEAINEQSLRNVYANQAAYASANVGRAVFSALLMLETLLVVVLAPAFTAGAISLEREKQTLDMLATTPISSLAIVVGKLFSALVYVFILVFASIPLAALVFVFGGVAPDDVVRGYVVLIATAIGIGSLGLFFSALAQRTQAATIMSYFAVLAATLGTAFVFVFWSAFSSVSVRADGTIARSTQPPEALMYLNAYFAQADVLCGTEGVESYGQFCSQVAWITGRDLFGGSVPIPSEPTKPGVDFRGANVRDGEPVPAIEADAPLIEPQPFGLARDTFWPKSVIAWLVLSVILTVLSVQLVSPTRRWRPRPPGILRRRSTRSPT